MREGGVLAGHYGTVGTLIKAPLQIRSHRTFQDIFSAPKKAPSGRKIIFLEAPFIGEGSHVGNLHRSTQDGYHEYDQRLLQARSSSPDTA